MYTLKIITTFMIVILSLCIAWFWKSAERSRATDIGFGIMLLVYGFSLIIFWWQ